MKHIKHIFFDLDHTLWDFDSNSALAFDKIFKTDFPQIKTNDFIEVYAPINQACWKLYQHNEITHEELRYNRLKQSFDVLNISISDDEINKISEDYITNLPENNLLFDGAIEILDFFSEKYILHIITNGFAGVQEKKLTNSGLKNYFKTITNSELAGAKKPHPTIYEFALNSANAKKENSIMIGDCIDADVRGAIEFGIEAIYFNPTKIEVEKNIVQIEHLLELKTIFI